MKQNEYLYCVLRDPGLVFALFAVAYPCQRANCVVQGGSDRSQLIGIYPLNFCLKIGHRRAGLSFRGGQMPSSPEAVEFSRE